MAPAEIFVGEWEGWKQARKMYLKDEKISPPRRKSLT